jgi:hypothetical protein
LIRSKASSSSAELPESAEYMLGVISQTGSAGRKGRSRTGGCVGEAAFEGHEGEKARLVAKGDEVGCEGEE